MLAKSSVVVVVGLFSVLATANPNAPQNKISYPAGMPSECIPYYTPPTVCPSPPTAPGPSSVPGGGSPGGSTPGSGSPTNGGPSYPGGGLPTLPSIPVSVPSLPSGTEPPRTGLPTPPPYSQTKPSPTKTITVTSTPTATTISQCNTGNAHCCNSVKSARSSSAHNMLGVVGVVLHSADVLVGLGCTPITAIGVGSGANCAQQPVCCSNNTYNGLINIGCSPISL